MKSMSLSDTFIKNDNNRNYTENKYMSIRLLFQNSNKKPKIIYLKYQD